MEINARLIEGITKCALNTAKTVAKEVAPEIKALGSEAPVFERAVSPTNPFVMDANATLARLKITPNFKSEVIKLEDIRTNQGRLFGIQPESEYRIFEEKVLGEIKLATKTIKEKLLREINPVNSTNIEHIKSELRSFTKELDPALEQEFLNCNEPDKLFELIKKNLNKIANSKNRHLHADLLARAKANGITPELQNEYNNLLTNSFNRCRKLINIFTPKSTNIEVLKIEEEVKRLGINDVNFSNDLNEAKLVKEAIEDLIKRNVPLPHSITVTPMLRLGNGGIAMNTVTKLERNGHIFLPTSIERKFANEFSSDVPQLAKMTDVFKKASVEYQDKVLSAINNINSGNFSTKNPKHFIYHETAHAFEPTTLESAIMLLNKDEMRVAGEISQYARELPNGREAMPEMFAKLMDGQSLTDKQMELYLKLGGIVPKS